MDWPHRPPTMVYSLDDLSIATNFRFLRLSQVLVMTSWPDQALSQDVTEETAT